ncbi:MAG: hypothetical protein NFCOHLIN_01771 [Gammaproteobacteria bacterium]|nr:hypothetical protein [Gammaproteobacteria bacterium]
MRRAASIGQARGSGWRRAVWAVIAMSGLAAAPPPLPDLWQRQLPEIDGGDSYMELVPMADGDVAVVRGSEAVAFFSGAAVQAGHDRAGATPGTTNPYEATLADGGTVRRIGPPGCVRRPGVTLAVEDADRHTVAECALLWVLEEPRLLTAAECDLRDMPPVIQRIAILDPQLLGLRDGTFLAADTRLGLVVRFTPRFDSGTPLLNDRLLRMPAAAIRDMVKRYDRPVRDGGFHWAGFQLELEGWARRHRRPPAPNGHPP